MSSTGPAGEQLGNLGGHLGRWYLAHVEGSIASVRFLAPLPRQTVFDYERDIDGVYIRRQFSFLPRSTSASMDCPTSLTGWGTGSCRTRVTGTASSLFIYLALASPLGPSLAPEVQRLSITGGRSQGRRTAWRPSHHAARICRTSFGTRSQPGCSPLGSRGALPRSHSSGPRVFHVQQGQPVPVPVPRRATAQPGKQGHLDERDRSAWPTEARC